MSTSSEDVIFCKTQRQRRSARKTFNKYQFFVIAYPYIVQNCADLQYYFHFFLLIRQQHMHKWLWNKSAETQNQNQKFGRSGLFRVCVCFGNFVPCLTGSIVHFDTHRRNKKKERKNKERKRNKEESERNIELIKQN